MADPEKPKLERPPESPTTARELDFDDEDLSSSPKPSRPTTGTGTTPMSHLATTESAPPPQPPRPLSPRQQAENTLKEAFPSIDAAVVKAVLTASGGQVEPAFHALLGMSDPDSQQEPTPPPQPPRPSQSPRVPSGLSQVEADEQYARQLAEQYNGLGAYGGAPRSGSREYRAPRAQRPKKETGLKPNELHDDREHSFIDDDLPVIRDNIKKGFLETQSKVNSFITNLRKRIDGDEEDNPPQQPARTGTRYNTGSTQQQYGGRRSGDRDRYDADPQVLDDDFANLQMRDETAPPRRSTRPLANPDLFKPTPSTPQDSDRRRVSFQDGPPEEIDDLYRDRPEPTIRPTSSASRSKWQPLAAVDPLPVSDHDPFSLGDSDDDDAKKKDIKPEDSERLKKATAETVPEEGSAERAGLAENVGKS